MHGRKEECGQGFDGKARRKETTWKTQGVDGRMGSEWVLGRLAGGLWIEYSWLRIEAGGRCL
jgi:hypothetical protein